MKLTPQQIEFFNREGWLFLPELFSQEEVDFLAPDLGPVGVVDVERLACEEIHLLLAEQLGEEQPTLAAEELQLRVAQFHGAPPPFADCCHSAAARSLNPIA